MASIAAHAPKLASQPLLPWSNPADGERRPLSDQACQQWVTCVGIACAAASLARPCAKFQKLSVGIPVVLGAEGYFPMGADIRSLLTDV